MQRNGNGCGPPSRLTQYRAARTTSPSGFTLIEMMVTLSLVVVLGSLAAPYFRNLMLSNQLTGYTNDFVLATHAARLEAIKRTQNVRVSALDASSAANEWGPGMVVYIDVDASGTFNAGDEQIRTLAAVPGTQTIDGPDGVSSFDFLPDGGTSVGAITWQLCDERTTETGRSITINTSGQVSATDYTCS